MARRRDDTSLGEKFADLAVAVKEKASDAFEDAADAINKTRQDWDRQRRRGEDDEDGPVYRGNRNYEGVGVGVGEALARKRVDAVIPRHTGPGARPRHRAWTLALPPVARRATWRLR